MLLNLNDSAQMYDMGFERLLHLDEVFVVYARWDQYWWRLCFSGPNPVTPIVPPSRIVWPFKCVAMQSIPRVGVGIRL